MDEAQYVEYTKEQCLFALKESAKNCRLGNMICFNPTVVVGIYNYISDEDKLYVVNVDQGH